MTKGNTIVSIAEFTYHMKYKIIMIGGSNQELFKETE